MNSKLHCSFCDKSQTQVRRLVAGPGGVFICNECVDLCRELMNDEWVPPTRAPTPAVESVESVEGPLGGVRVLELANFMAGPYCGMLLADMGAEVIKVENPKVGDYTRETPPFVEGESAGFLALNRNKKSITLDLKAPEGRALFLELAREVDVILENFRPGTIRDLGIDYESVKTVSPAVIYCSASGFGQTGPYSQRPGFDLILQGMSGLMSITGEPEGAPVKVGVPIADLTARSSAPTASCRPTSPAGRAARASTSTSASSSRPWRWASGRPRATSRPVSCRGAWAPLIG